MEKLQGFTDHVMLYVKTLVKWLLAAALIGTVGGAVGSLFRLGVEYATELRTEVPALLYALPPARCVRTLARKMAGMSRLLSLWP